MNPAKIVAWSTLFLLPIVAAVALIALASGSIDPLFARAASGAATEALAEANSARTAAAITDLAIGTSVFPAGQINPGQSIGYNIIVTNTGSTVVGNAILTDLLSPHILDRRVYSSGTTIDNSEIQPRVCLVCRQLGSWGKCLYLHYRHD